MKTSTTNSICEIMNAFGRNVPHYAFPKDCQEAYKVEKGGDIHATSSNNNGGFHLEKIDCDYAIVPMKAMRILYDGRYCAVSGFIFAIVDGKYSVLANKRGEGTPDYQGCWNCPCGFLERNEDSKTGIAREIKEECNFDIDPKRLKIVYVETEPERCNNGNVTIRHRAFIGHQNQISITEVDNTTGEVNEVSDIRWISVDDINKYEWAFHHDETIAQYIPGKFTRRLIELFDKLIHISVYNLQR